MAKTQSIDLAGRVRDLGPVRFTSAELPRESHDPLVLVRYSLNNVQQQTALRLDLGKRAFIDELPVAVDAEGLSLAAEAIAESIRRPRYRLGREPHAVKISSSFELLGTFWPTSDPATQRPGVVRYSPASGLSIDLQGAFEDFASSLTGGSSFPAINANFTDGSIATFFDTFVNKRTALSGGDGTSSLVANSCVFGCHFDGISELPVRSVHVWSQDIVPWLNVRLIEKSPSATISWKQCENLIVGFRDGDELQFRASMSSHSRWPERIELVQQGFADIRYRVSRTLEQAIRDWAILHNLLNFVVGEWILPDLVQFAPADGPKGSDYAVSYFAKPRTDKRSGREHDSEMFIPRSVFWDHRETIVNRWFEMSDLPGRPLDALFGVAVQPKASVDTDFIMVIAAIERYFASMAYEAGMTTEQRIGSALERLPEDLKTRLKERDAFRVERILEERNHVLHGGRSNTERPGLWYFKCSVLLRAVLQANVLRDLGVGGGSISRCILETRDVDWVLQTAM